LTRSYNQWRSDIDALAQRGTHIPALEVNPDRMQQSGVLKLLCSMETGQVTPLDIIHLKTPFHVPLTETVACDG
jgi:hypothetical protein